MNHHRGFQTNRRFVAPLSLYTKPPRNEISIEDFQQFAVDRLRVLRIVEDGKIARRHPSQIYENICSVFNEAFSRASGEEAAQADLCSHYILRLAFCQSEELRRWLLQYECDFFTMRFNGLSETDKATFCRLNEIPFEEVSKPERRALKSKLSDVFFSCFDFVKSKAVNAEDYTIFYKVPFEQVPELLTNRRVYLHKGFAYVSKDDVVSLIARDFRARMSKDLARLFRLWSSEILQTEDDRLVPIIQSLKSTYTGPDFTAKSTDGEVHKQDLLELSKSSFPLCMKYTFDKLLQEHHLKHNGRQQLSLFLKVELIHIGWIHLCVQGIGLPLSDALQFWKEAFYPKTTPEKFEKEYAYNIRHNYGKEGKRADYAPYSCMKVISATPGVGEHHGCPFKIFTEIQLHQSLGEMQIKPGVRRDIITTARSQNYQVACCMAWEAKAGKSLPDGIQHPNQYFREMTKQK